MYNIGKINSIVGSNISSITSELLNINTLTELENWCAIFCQQLRFSYFRYKITTLTLPDGTNSLVYDNYPQNWLEQYAAQRYEHVDPIALHCRQHSVPIIWQSINPNDYPNPHKTKEFIAFCRNFGLRSGFSVSLHGSYGEYGEFSLVSRASHEDKIAAIHASLPIASYAALYLLEATQRLLYSARELPLFKRLTPREHDCLMLIAEGKTNAQLARTLSIAERTVSFHLENACKKLNSATRAQAIAKAVALHLIKPQLHS